MKVQFREIDRGNLRDVLRLKVSEGECEFIAPNSFSLAEAYVEEGLKPQAIYADSRLVGFIMYGKWLGADSYWITRLMISPEHRRCGYARESVGLAISNLFTQTDCDRISISFVPQNEPARRLYESLGFREVGTIEDEIRYELCR